MCRFYLCANLPAKYQPFTLLKEHLPRMSATLWSVQATQIMFSQQVFYLKLMCLKCKTKFMFWVDDVFVYTMIFSSEPKTKHRFMLHASSAPVILHGNATDSIFSRVFQKNFQHQIFLLRKLIVAKLLSQHFGRNVQPPRDFSEQDIFLVSRHQNR